MDNTENVATLLSLCTGYGGMERGIRTTGFRFRTVCYVECEAYAVANLAKKIETGKMDAAPIWSDVKTLPLEPFRNRIDVLVGGYPCQPFSMSGHRKGTDDDRNLWPYIAKTIQAIKPFRCFFENVEGHITKGLRNVIADLAEMDYRSAWGIFSAVECGASHKRKRVFIMADANGAGRNEDRQSSKSWSTRFVKPSGNSRHCKTEEVGQIQRWTAKPKSQQFDWEESRVIKSGLGRAIDGRGKRNHRLRLLGNGVVPATATIAWNVLQKRLMIYE